jgi:hypothetical protein
MWEDCECGKTVNVGRIVNGTSSLGKHSMSSRGVI